MISNEYGAPTQTVEANGITIEIPAVDTLETYLRRLEFNLELFARWPASTKRSKSYRKDVQELTAELALVRKALGIEVLL